MARPGHDRRRLARPVEADRPSRHAARLTSDGLDECARVRVDHRAAMRVPGLSFSGSGKRSLGSNSDRLKLACIAGKAGGCEARSGAVNTSELDETQKPRLGGVRSRFRHGAGRDAGSPPGGAGARGVYRHPNGIAVGLGRGERHWVHRRRSASGVARPVMNSEHPGPTRRRPPRPPHRTSHCHFHCHPRRSRRRGTARQTQKPLRRAASGRWALLGSNQRPPACRAGALPTELSARTAW